MSEEHKTFGRYTAVRGKLHKEDSRAAYVLGPTLAGDRIAPISSHWSFEDACRKAEELDREDREPVPRCIYCRLRAAWHTCPGRRDRGPCEMRTPEAKS